MIAMTNKLIDIFQYFYCNVYYWNSIMYFHEKYVYQKISPMSTNGEKK